MTLDFNLTPAQNRAYKLAEQFVGSDNSIYPHAQYHSALIHAVCGAGKTETVFGAVLEVLNHGGRVLYATPRRDLVKELGERVQEAFPNTSIQSLYGGSPDSDHSDKVGAELIVATTHQVMRFYNAFDLVILDEVDAFPYHGSDRLPRLINRARKFAVISGDKVDNSMDSGENFTNRFDYSGHIGEMGKTIYITATPHKNLLEGKTPDSPAGESANSHSSTAVSGKTVSVSNKPYQITIPARYHGYPAPEPELIKGKLDPLHKAPHLPGPLADFLRRHVGVNPVFAFVPTVSMTEPAAAGLSAWCQRQNIPARVEAVSSQDGDRDRKRRDFQRGEIDLLVTTTIMERGITVAGARVVVLFSHHHVFDSRTLIQIAGRSGRKKQDPEGEVLFVGENISQNMKAAKQSIMELNQEASELGYLVTDYSKSKIP